MVVLFLCLSLVALPFAASAHSPWSDQGENLVPLLMGMLCLLLFWLAYTSGSFRAHPGWRRAACFHLAALLAAFTLFGPLDHWAETDAAAHMAQHMFMMVLIAPLWVLARPLPQLSTAWKKLVLIWGPALRLAAMPLTAAIVHAAAIWFWHAPRFYLLALDNEWWHVVEHACFILTAGIFWWAVLRASTQKAPHAFLALLLTLMHTGFLGALLTFAREPLYGPERGLESQQLAGLIMWVLGGVPYVAAAAWIALRWLRQMMLRSTKPGDCRSDKRSAIRHAGPQ